MARSMSFFHVGERLLAAPKHKFRLIMPDFPDKRSRPYRATPDNEVVDFIDVSAAAHATSDSSCETRQVLRDL